MSRYQTPQARLSEFAYYVTVVLFHAEGFTSIRRESRQFLLKMAENADFCE
jgi:hypothetical protein